MVLGMKNQLFLFNCLCYKRFHSERDEVSFDGYNKLNLTFSTTEAGRRGLMVSVSMRLLVVV